MESQQEERTTGFTEEIETGIAQARTRADELLAESDDASLFDGNTEMVTLTLTLTPTLILTPTPTPTLTPTPTPTPTSTLTPNLPLTRSTPSRCSRRWTSASSS